MSRASGKSSDCECSGEWTFQKNAGALERERSMEQEATEQRVG